MLDTGCLEHCPCWCCFHRDFADSKTLSSDARDNLFASICKDEQLGYCSEILSAQFISTQMLSKATISLNALANNSTFNIIRRLLAAGVNITHVRPYLIEHGMNVEHNNYLGI